MIKGLYAAASAMVTGLVRQNALAHNVANLDTPGFKQLMISMDDFIQIPVVHPPRESACPGQMSMVGYLGLGVEPAPETIDFTQGALRFTGQPLDLAIQGPGFFRVQTPNGERYTRDGRFLLDANGQLVTVDGYQVLNEAGQPIEIPDGNLMVLGDGTLIAGGEEVGQLGFSTFEIPEDELIRDLPNVFESIGEPTSTDSGIIQQGYLEMANADPAEIMTQMVMVARAYEAAQKMVQTQDELLGKTIASLGRM